MLSPTYYLQTVISPNFGGNLIADRKLFFLYIEKFVDSYFAQKFGGMTIPMTTSEKSCNEQDQEPASIIKKWPNIKNDKKWPDTCKVIFCLVWYLSIFWSRFFLIRLPRSWPKSHIRYASDSQGPSKHQKALLLEFSIPQRQKVWLRISVTLVVDFWE